MRTAVWLILVAGLGVASAGCLKAASFACATGEDCGAGGTCEPEGFCSFVDPGCPSGRRFGELAGSYTNACVGVGSPDAGSDSCLGTGAYTVCLEIPPLTVTLTGTLNTDTDPRCEPQQPAAWAAAGQPDACFIAGAQVEISDSVAVRAGSRPLVLVAGTTLSITGTLDVSSRQSGSGGNVSGVGPGSPAAACTAASGTPQGSGDGAGGGAGGSFMTAGGAGATGNNGASSAGTAASADALAPSMLRGGCPGQRGGNGGGGGNASGASGPGGGALFLVAGTSITVSGAINASGAGGAGGGERSGGSGGGSGGMIVLHAPSITATGARVFANGGGASQGGDSNTNGANGSDAPSDPTSPANGGASGMAGGPGGRGFALGTSAESGTAGSDAEGGGGGGGGGGFILSNQPLPGAIVSPAETISGS